MEGAPSATTARRSSRRSTALRIGKKLDASVGIGLRLAIAFSAVAVLVLAANLLAQYGIAVVRTTRIEAAPESLPSPAPAAAPQAATASQPVQTRPQLDSLRSAVTRFDRAVRLAKETGAAENTSDLLAATAELREETSALVTQASGVIDNGALDTLIANSFAYRKSGAEIVRNAYARRQILAEYSRRFDELDAQMKASLDDTWKIFGRVIARKSLIDLARNLDDIRRQSAPLATPRGYDKPALERLAVSQLDFATALETNARSLARSQGEEFVSKVRADFEQIVSLRTQLVLTDEASVRATAAYSQHGESLNAAIRALPKSGGLESKSSGRVAVASVEQSPIRDPKLAPSASPVTDARVTSTAVPENNASRVWIACASIGVLLLVLFISVGTVRSITRPVRRFIATTHRLAAGERGARVPRGGIRELDALAVAFNEMADQLTAAQAVAREYQSRLEIRVEERTRQLQHLAEHDPLTQLPNRRQLATYLEAALAKAAASAGHVGVLFLDLDNFKTINDSMGHAFGDCLLQGIAERLRDVATSAGFAARLGGDEFTVVYESAQGIDAVRRIGEALVASFQKPLLIDGRDLVISISVGASVFPEHGTDSESLLRAADAALFNAKASGRSRLSVFSPDLLEAASSKFRIEQGLRRALEHGELELLFQPEVGLETFTITLVEALLRWRLPDGTYVPPAHFLSVAEESGLIMDISDWVLRTAIEAAARWHQSTWPNVRIAVNVSARQLLDGGFVERVTELLRMYRLPAHRLEIELTENVLQTGPATVEVLRRLREVGIAVALDDFGTGYSSLASLEQLPLTRVKLDRSLIDSIDTNERSLAIARAIIGLCENLGLEVTAEGIERPGQLALLWNCPHMFLQGYLLCKPVAQELLPEIARRMPKHMQTLLLTSPATAAMAAAPASTASSTTTSFKTERAANVVSVADDLLAKQLG